MEFPVLAVSCSLSFVLGWWLRGCGIEKEIPAPCSCQCSCIHQPETPTPAFGFGAYFFVSLLFLLCVALGSVAALVFKVSITQREGEQEFAFSVKGKSKGVFNPRRALQIKAD